MHHPEREQTAPQLRPAAENTLKGEKARQPRARMQRAQPCERTNLEDIMDEVGAYRTMVEGVLPLLLALVRQIHTDGTVKSERFKKGQSIGNTLCYGCSFCRVSRARASIYITASCG